MTDRFEYDVFLSHSSKDKAIVRRIAERLREDGLRVWFDEWLLAPGDSIPSRIEEGLERSRVLVLCMSANALGSDWARLESGTFRFRDPLNKARRFIPVRLDDAPIPGSLGQFVHIAWPPQDEDGYARLIEACRPSRSTNATSPAPAAFAAGVPVLSLGRTATVYGVAFSPDGHCALSGSEDSTVRVWALETGTCERVLEGHTGSVFDVAFSPDGRRALSGSFDGTVRVWALGTGTCERVLEGHTGSVFGVAFSPDGRRALSGSFDGTVRVWALGTGTCERVLEGHVGSVFGVAFSPDGDRALSGSEDSTVRVWALGTGTCDGVLEGHTGSVFGVAFSPDGRRALSGSKDSTVRVWALGTGTCERVLEGHTGAVQRVIFNHNGGLALSVSAKNCVRSWVLGTGDCDGVLDVDTGSVVGVAFSSNGRRAFCAAYDGVLHIWRFGIPIASTGRRRSPEILSAVAPDVIQYTNAKVLLVGESGSGKTGLSNRLALGLYRETDSTVGAWATQWQLSAPGEDEAEREVWLWDFGGQADQRLIHQLYMDQTHLAALVFDPQKDDLFSALRTWDHDLTRACPQRFCKILVAARVDAGGLRSASREQVERFASEHGFARYIETSAKDGTGCNELRQAILELIDWKGIAQRTAPILFRRLKEEIVRLKDEGRALMRFNELREALTLRLKERRFSDEELRAVIMLLTGPGVVWDLGFGSWILLQPERINCYAQAVICTLRQEDQAVGCIIEQRVLNGDLVFPKAVSRLSEDEERIVLLAMHRVLVERGLCLRDEDPSGRDPTLLFFPSYARQERPDLVEHPSVSIGYRFTGFLEDVYATLIVRLRHTGAFEPDRLWRDAADFSTLAGRRMGVKLTRRADGMGELEAYFDPEIPVEEIMIFSRYIHEHLLRKGKNVERLRHYVCTHCGTPVQNREVAMRRLRENGRGASIVCVECERRVKLWDELEERFAAPDVRERVRQLDRQSQIVLDNESRERALVGEVVSTVALAGQISREFSVSDHGIDMEVEFRHDDGAASGQKVYLQLKSGDSHLRRRKRDNAEIFYFGKPRHAEYWMSQAFPVMLIIRGSDGEIRWMEVRDWLRNASSNGRKRIRQIEFMGGRFDVMSVRRWREETMRKAVPER